MDKLEEVVSQCRGSERAFPCRSILFLGSESYDAPTITIVQGLQELGFAIYTLKKPNINSWFCNQVVESTGSLRFDFVLSNLHWGTRWSYYREFKLMSSPKVLMDGDDNPDGASWREKYARYARQYNVNAPDSIKNGRLSPYRWVEALGEYSPDLVFTSQKSFRDQSSLYLPFGIHKEYKEFHENKSTEEREIHWLHIPGPGSKRSSTRWLLAFLSLLKIFPGVVVNREIRGEDTIPESIREPAAEDKNIHSYQRWTSSKAYFRVLNHSRVLIYPGVEKGPWWDSKRPWEAYASGCLPMLANPTIDVSEYPVTQVCPFAVFHTPVELIEKCRYLFKNPSFLEKLRREAVEKAWNCFSPLPLARYFLARVKAIL